MTKSDYYAVLGVLKTDNQATIKLAYYRLAKQYHPDKNPGNTAYAERFKEINEAYMTLSDVQKRKEYDSLLNRSIQGRQKEDLPFVYYLKFDASKTFIKQFEEVKLAFKFPSEARFFKRQKFDDWYIVEGPNVMHTAIEIDGVKRKETQIHYILAPLKMGSLSLEAPSVVINNKRVNANPLYFTVQPQQCYVNPLENAIGQPLIVELEKRETIKTKHFIKNITRKRLVLIPLGKKYQSQLKRARLIAFFSATAIAVTSYYFLDEFAISSLLFLMCYFSSLLVLEYFKQHRTVHSLIERHAVYRHLKGGGYTISKRNLPLYLSHELYILFKRK